MKKIITLIILICCLFSSCSKELKSALNMPNSKLNTDNYNTQIKADEFSDNFYEACANGSLKNIEKHIKKGKSVNELDAEGYSPLFYAVLGGNPSAYSEALLKLKNAIINDDDKALYEALDCVPPVKSNTKVVEYLIKNGANVKLKDRDERPVFVYAALFANDTNVLSILKNAGAEIDYKITIQYPSSLLSIACMTNPNAEVIDFLCKEGGNIDEQNEFGTTPIMWAAMYTSNPDVIDVLKKNGADINDKRHKDGYSPLIWSVRCNRNPEITERLCKLGADLSVTDKYSFDAICWALTDFTSSKCVESLGKWLEFRDNFSEWKTLLTGLKSKGKNEHLKVLLNYCDNNIQNEDVIWLALFSSDENFIDVMNCFELTDDVFNDNEFIDAIESLLEILTILDDVEKLKYLNTKIECDVASLYFYSALYDSNLVLKYLVNEGFEIDFGKQKMMLFFVRTTEQVEIFLAAPFIDVYKKDDNGKTLLYVACELENYAAVKYLIEKGSDVNTTCSSHKSRTPLLSLCYEKEPSLEIVKLLVKNGARVNVKDEDGVFPLVAACSENENDSVIRFLINNGANKTEKYKGLYPYQYCNSTIKNNYYSTYRILWDAATDEFWY